MNIKQKTLMLLCIIFLLLNSAGYLIQYYVVMPNFIELEQQQAKTDLQRVIHAIENNISNLDNITRDWATWDDSYDFIQHTNRQFINNNLNQATFDILKLNLIIYLDPDKNLVWGQAYDHHRQQPLPDRSLIKNLLPELINLTKFPANQKNIAGQDLNGLYIHNDLPMLLAARPILTSHNKGPVAGYLIFGQFLDPAMEKMLAKQIEVNFSLQGQSKQNTTERYVFNPINSQKLLISTTLPALNHSLSLKIETQNSREITQSGLTSLNHAMFCVSAILFIIVVVSGILLRREIIKPVQDLTRLIANILDQNNYSLRIHSIRKDEIGLLEKQFDNLLTQIESDNQQLIQLASTDKLTQLANRLELAKVLEKEWHQLRRTQLPMSIIMLDLDFFKLYNDCYGHQLGDVCLRKVANVLKDSVRRPIDLAARYGGEEFILVLPDTNQQGALLIASSIKAKLKLEQIPHTQSTVSQWVTVSIGVATTIPTQEIHYEKLIHQADQALYLAKQQGRDQIHHYSNETTIRAIDDTELKYPDQSTTKLMDKWCEE